MALDDYTNELSEFVTFRSYARWLDDLKRREIWSESVGRYIGFLHGKFQDIITADEWSWLERMFVEKRALGSMRLLWAAGPAAEANAFTVYNCTYAAIRDLKAFSEALYILMCGCGFGYSVEEQYVSDLPRIRKQRHGAAVETHVIADDKIGWATALEIGLTTWYDGRDIVFDYSAIRSRGAKLLTMGGRASGPEPLKRLLDFARQLVMSRQGARLTPYQAHSLMCMIAEIVVVGGVRRSSLISLSDLSDTQMRDCKSGEFWNSAPHLRMANNTGVHEVRPTNIQLLDEFQALIKSQSGERGIFVRTNGTTTAPRRKKSQHFGINPCGEILLLDMECCNLSEAVARIDDTYESLAEKQRASAIFGTLQSTFTDFKYVRPDWKKNAEEERLLGCSITGIMDAPVVRDAEVLQKLRQVAINTNVEFAGRLGINQSVAVTCIKPSGTVSQVVNSSSGIHTRWSRYYVRRIRIAASDPLFQFASISGVPKFPEVQDDPINPSTWVLEFPVEAPDTCITRHDVNAIEQLETWKLLKVNYTEHNPSATVYVDENEWIDVVKWINDNWAIIGGLSFLPKTHHVYALAPYEEITKDDYEARVAAFPTLDYSLLQTLESDDNTQGARELACASGQCDV